MKKRLVVFAIGFFVLDSFMTLDVQSATKIQKSNLDVNNCQMNTYDEKSKRYISEKEFDLIASCVEAEAGNQDQTGKRLVVDVILNRVDSDRFPDDIESVISQKYHFSTFWNGEMDKIKSPSKETIEAIDAELEAITDEKILFFTSGGYNKYCTPAYQYGAHYFGY